MAESAVRVVVIGGGPGGYVAAIHAAHRGAAVTVVERDLLGGTCLNRGCIPTKTLLAGASAFGTAARGGAEFGFAVHGEVVPDWPAMQERKARVVTRLREGVHTLLKKAGVTLVPGTALVTGPGHVQVRPAESAAGPPAAPPEPPLELDADRIIIATGSEPMRPPFFDFSRSSILDSTSALEIGSIPRSILILGGGAIGCEFAGLFGELGCRVTLIELMPQLLPTEDVRVARQLQGVMRKTGVEVLTKTRLEAVVEAEAERVVVTLEGGRRLEAEKMLVAVGRRPCTEGLGLQATGISMDERGYVMVNERLETSVPGIYAVGDVNGGLMQAHVASHEGMVAAENCTGAVRERTTWAIPRCVYGVPEVAAVGLSEEEAREEGYRPVTGTFRHGALGKALALGEEQGYAQIIADHDSGRLLGAVVMGHNATDVIHEVAVAMQLGATARQLGEVVHGHPSMAEAVMEAARDVHGESVHVAG
ncbi:MAG: dihydrolipoyl dehydrogenase [Gaiellales bacterium]|nr:dihydrolipoyl dehydrogenase [Gaiellales bacterium]